MHRRNALLFFPASRPDMLDKALASGAERVCMDLEDAVPTADKDRARDAARAIFERSDVDVGRLALRINAAGSEPGQADLAMLVERSGKGPLPWIVVPKVESADTLTAVLDALGGHGADARLVALVESARGLDRVEGIASAEGVTALLFGALDMSTDLGCALEWDALLYARSRIVLAARVARVAAIDAPYFDVEDLEGLRSESERVRRLGFRSKAAIHPRQVETIDLAFAPSAAEIERARRVLEADARAGGGAHLVDGTMVDAPAVDAARRVLAHRAPPPTNEE